eukprot:TRINITY_DN575_c0_g7_i1.p1 TRINITY_DN575_c0_g7~~TRINITY_DN575_c0_g7_i1.p1  ORF type:complete len:104 (-),score=31.35 TRINITY_DN575_c0_g7_i1:546-857(-)
MAGTPQEKQVRASINQKLIETGEKERLKDMLRTKLVECGWRDEMKAFCKDIIRNKGLENITAEELVAEMKPKGRSQIPQPVKAELLGRIRRFLANNAAGTGAA